MSSTFLVSISPLCRGVGQNVILEQKLMLEITIFENFYTLLFCLLTVTTKNSCNNCKNLAIFKTLFFTFFVVSFRLALY